MNSAGQIQVGGGVPNPNQNPNANANANLQSSLQLNVGLQQQLNLEDVKHRAMDLFNAISRIRTQLESNPNLKWQDVLGQFSVVNLALVNIVDDIKKVSKAFVVYPKHVNQENSLKLPVMLSTKLLPEMESEETTMKEHVLAGISNQPVLIQIEKLKGRIESINSACASAEKVINEFRKLYGLSSRHTPGIIAPLDKVQVAKIEEQERLLRSAVNHGEELRLPADQRVELSSIPPHLEAALATSDADTSLPDSVGTLYSKNPLAFSPAVSTNHGAQQLNSAAQQVGRSAVSSMVNAGLTGDNKTASPMQYANSPMSTANVMNVPSPQQQRQKLAQMPQTQSFQAQQQLRPQSGHVNLQSHMTHSQEQQAKHQQERQAYHNFPNRQFLSGSGQQHSIGQNPNLQAMQPKHHLQSGNPSNIYGGNQSFLPSQTFNVAPMYSRNFSSQGFNVGGSQSSTNPVPPQQHGGTNFSTFPNVQFGGQSNLPGITNVPIPGAGNFSTLSNPVSNFSSMANFTQNSLHGQTNYGNIPNPMQNTSMGHARQPPPQ